MAFQENSQPRQRKASEIALVLALLAGALALVISIGGLLINDLVGRAQPYVFGHKTNQTTSSTQFIPKLDTRIDGDRSNIVEVDSAGRIVRVVYSSEIKSHAANFSLFAVPQTGYNGKAYLQSTQDASSGTLIIYPLDVVTGKLLPAVINAPSHQASVSPDQTRVAVLTLSPTKTLTAFDLTSGTAVTSWTLAPNEHITNDPATWISNACFELVISTSSATETRIFCLPL